MMDFISLLSDTETRPTESMRAAMAAAVVGDEQRHQDPTVLELLDRVKFLLGKEAALFLPSGTMCNIVAIATHTKPGDIILADAMGHIVRAETGGLAFHSGLMLEPIESERGIFTEDAFHKAWDRIQTSPEFYSPVPRLLCLEQTHNFGGGTVWSLEKMRAICQKAKQQGLKTHLDGARLMNAVVASGTSAQEFASCVDSLWIDFTKGLGAPVGAVLAGTKEFIYQAYRFKHIFGGALRQAGIVAAGCLYALEHHIERLEEDHQNAQYLAQALNEMEGLKLTHPKPDTNIILFEVEAPRNADEFLNRLKQAGVLVSKIGNQIRAVTHLDVSRTDIEKSIDIINQVTKSY